MTLYRKLLENTLSFQTINCRWGQHSSVFDIDRRSCLKSLRGVKRLVFCSILSSLVFLFHTGHPDLQGQEVDRLAQAKDLLSMDLLPAKAKIETFNAEHARDLISQIRHLGREHYEDLDHLYLVLEHLSTLEATELAQKRLDNLLLVLGLTLALFTLFLIYVVMDQRKTLSKLHTIVAGIGVERGEKTEIYRGESP